MYKLSNLARMCVLSLLAMVALPGWAASSERLDPGELATLLEKAETPEDHLKLSAHYSAEGEQLEKDAERHQSMAGRYRRSNLPQKIRPSRRGLVKHCQNLAQSLRNAAKAARQLADLHKSMADELAQ